MAERSFIEQPQPICPLDEERDINYKEKRLANAERAKQEVHRLIAEAEKVMGDGAQLRLRLGHLILRTSHKLEPPKRFLKSLVITSLAVTEVDAYIDQLIQDYEDSLNDVGNNKDYFGTDLRITSIEASGGSPFRLFSDRGQAITSSLRLFENIDLPAEHLYVVEVADHPDWPPRVIFQTGKSVIDDIDGYLQYKDHFPDALIQCTKIDLVPGQRKFLEENLDKDRNILLDNDKAELEDATGEDWEHITIMNVDELVELFIVVYGVEVIDAAKQAKVRELYTHFWDTYAPRDLGGDVEPVEISSYSYVGYFLANIFADDYNTIQVESAWSP